VSSAEDGRIPVRLSIRTLGETPERSASATAFVETVSEPPYKVVARLPAPFAVKPGGRYLLSAEQVVSPSETARRNLSGLRPSEAFMNCRLERWRSYTVADWQDAEDLLTSLQAKAREPYVNPHAVQRLELSRNMLRRGRPLAAYRAAIRAEQLLYPSAFVVQPPGGRLSPFPIRLRFTEDRVKATVVASSTDLATILLLSGVPQEVTVEHLGRRTQVVLSADRPAEVTFELKQ